MHIRRLILLQILAKTYCSCSEDCFEMSDATLFVTIELSTSDCSGSIVLAALDLWLFESSSSSSVLLVLVTRASLQLSAATWDGVEDETNKGFAAGSISWSKALKFAQPTSFGSWLTFFSKNLRKTLVVTNLSQYFIYGFIFRYIICNLTATL